MRFYAKLFCRLTVLLLSVASWGQERHHPPDPDLIARLSYERSPIAPAGSILRVCVAVSDGGTYHVLQTLSDGEVQRLTGKMPEKQYQELKGLLEAGDFRALTGSHGGLIRQESESFKSEIRKHEDGSQRLQWLNADGESPFPLAVENLVNWLKQFRPADAKSFQYADYPDVCPVVGGLRLVQPSIAANGKR